MPQPETKNQVYHHSVRWSVEHTEENRDKLCKLFNTMSDKWIFQAEFTIKEGKENPHYQCYIHTKNKYRSKKLARSLNEDFRGINIQPASDAGKFALQNYAMKDDTRVAGPWADREIYRGQDLWPESKMPPWQQAMLKKLSKPWSESGDRKMYWIYDPVGNNGKTKFIKYLWFKKGALPLGYGHSTDVLNLVSKFPGRKVYCWNLTRSKPAQLSELDLYAAMESVKDGLFINLKYETAVVGMMPPHVLVCANHIPKRNQVSVDRWELLRITPYGVERAQWREPDEPN